MKVFVISLLLLSTTVQQRCKQTTSDNTVSASSATCYKGRLEIKGICSNYTISVQEGGLDTTRMMASWTDENTGKTYRNVFALGSPCTFPESIAEGQSFYFTLAGATEDCAVCQAYYPKPPKALAIKVLDKPCP